MFRAQTRGLRKKRKKIRGRRKAHKFRGFVSLVHVCNETAVLIPISFQNLSNACLKKYVFNAKSENFRHKLEVVLLKLRIL